MISQKNYELKNQQTNNKTLTDKNNELAQCVAELTGKIDSLEREMTQSDSINTNHFKVSTNFATDNSISMSSQTQPEGFDVNGLNMSDERWKNLTQENFNIKNSTQENFNLKNSTQQNFNLKNS